MWQLARERAAHAEAEAQRRALHELIMQIPAALSIQRGADHVYELVNPRYRVLVGGRALEGKPYLKAAPDVRAPGLLDQLDGVYASGEPFIGRAVRIEVRRGDGDEPEELFLDGVLQPIRAPTGEVHGVMTFAFDVTEQVRARRRAELLAAENARLLELAERARVQAEEMSRAKDVFLATVSHELRTPLTAVVGWTRMLQAGVLSPDKHVRALESIDRNAQALCRLVEDLVDSSRIASGNLRLDRRRAPIAPVVEAALETVRPLADAKGVRLEATLDQAAESEIDAARLQQVIWNLVINAVKFTPPDGVVRASLVALEREHEVRIHDSGQGIAPDLLPYIFEPFRQGPAQATPRSGLGLGLAIARHIVELHGGRIEAESAGAGLGACLTVRLPAAVESGKQSREAPGGALGGA